MSYYLYTSASYTVQYDSHHLLFLLIFRSFTSVDEFNDKFPGNTSDFSGSILNGWQLAVNEALDKLTDNNEELTMRH